MPHLDHLVITVSDFSRAHSVYQAICGGKSISHPSTDDTARFTRFYLGDSVVELAEPLNDPESGTGGDLQRRLDARGPGIHLICLPAEKPADVAEQLRKAGAGILKNDGHIYVHPKSCNGVLVQLTPRREFAPSPGSGDARLDHAAIAVVDLAQAATTWSLITGRPGDSMGIHPASNGSFEATRFLMGDQMIELVSPVQGVDSPMARRLATRGEGIMALALPAADLDRTLYRVRATDARVLWQEPHWMVHPEDAAGVMIQLTPRISH